MKIRIDFVTNSSSSSFILAFDTKHDVDDFNEFSDMCNYIEFYQLVQLLNSTELTVYNDTENPIPVSSMMDELTRLSLSDYAVKQLKEHKDDVLGKYEYFSIFLSNPLLGEYFDASTLGWEEKDYGSWSVRIFDRTNNCDKQEAIELLRKATLFDYAYNYIDKHIQKIENEEYLDYIKRKDAFAETEEYKQAMEDYLKTTDFYQKKKRIEDAFLVLGGMVWDTSGGVLEWAIRNGFIEDNFRRNCVLVYNVG